MINFLIILFNDNVFEMTKIMNNSENASSLEQNKHTKSKWIILGVVIGLAVVGLILYFVWLKPLLNKPISEAISQPDITPAELPTSVDPEESPSQESEQTPITIAELREKKEIALAQKMNPPACGDQKELMILATAIDYRGSDYLYGLADVIRLIHIDFTVPRVSVLALPRGLLVQIPTERITNVEGPILLNQAYLFGTQGMGHYQGTGFGAGALADTIYYNFGVDVDQYVVLDFAAFTALIDRVGGVKVDLPAPVDDRPKAFFPAGKQTLDGEEALQLARIRTKYSDNVRIDNQTIIIKAFIDKLRQPATLVRLPALADEMMDAVLTDAMPNQIPVGICLLNNLDNEDIKFYNPSSELITGGKVYIPTVGGNMDIFHWDSDLVEWIFEKLWLNPEE